MEDKVKKQWIVLEDEEEIVLIQSTVEKIKQKNSCWIVSFSLWDMNTIYDYSNTFSPNDLYNISCFASLINSKRNCAAKMNSKSFC